MRNTFAPSPLGVGFRSLLAGGRRVGVRGGWGTAWRSAGVALLAGWLALLSCGATKGVEPAAVLPNEYTLKAVFLYSFGRYVQWPENAFSDARAPFVISILGEDAFGGALDDIAAKKTIQERPIVVQRFAQLDDLQAPCHILFVSHALTDEQQAAVIAKTQGTPTLVVGETAGFAQRGATANFVADGDRIRFELNITAARLAQLRLDAKLLSLGKAVGAARNGVSEKEP